MENSLALSPAFLWQLQSYVNYAGASHFKNFPPNLATLILTKCTAGRRGAAMIRPTALETKKVPRFPEITSIAQRITPLDGKERSEVQNMLQSASSEYSTSKLQRLAWPRSHAALQMRI